jgi:transcriptional regulator with XRE-family HTH domain
MGKKLFSDQLRQIVRESGLSEYRISKEIKIPPETLNRFQNNQRGLKVDIIDKLCDFFNVRMTSDGHKKLTTIKKEKK